MLKCISSSKDHTVNVHNTNSVALLCVFVFRSKRLRRVFKILIVICCAFDKRFIRCWDKSYFAWELKCLLITFISLSCVCALFSSFVVLGVCNAFLIFTFIISCITPHVTEPRVCVCAWSYARVCVFSSWVFPAWRMTCLIDVSL